MGNHRLKDLTRPEALHQLVIEGLRSEFPPLKTLDFVPNNLPVELTSFVGRGELSQVLSQMEEARIVTLTGPGGTGKTRLSLQVAAELTGRFADGVWFVPLAAIREPDLITSAVATTLGLQPSAEDPDGRLAEYLRTKQLASGARQLRAGDRGGSQGGAMAAGGPGSSGARHFPGAAADFGRARVPGSAAGAARPRTNC